MARKLLLNQTVSRPMLRTLAQEKISTTPREVLDELAETVKDFFDYIPKVKQFAKDRLANLLPESDAKVLRNYGLTRYERCFYFTGKSKPEIRNNFVVVIKNKINSEYLFKTKGPSKKITENKGMKDCESKHSEGCYVHYSSRVAFGS